MYIIAKDWQGNECIIYSLNEDLKQPLIVCMELTS